MMSRCFEPWRFIWEIGLTYQASGSNLLGSYECEDECDNDSDYAKKSISYIGVRGLIKDSKKIVDLQRTLRRTKRKLDYWYCQTMRLREENDRLVHLLNNYRLLPMRYTKASKLQIQESEEKRLRYNATLREFGIVKSASYEI